MYIKKISKKSQNDNGDNDACIDCQFCDKHILGFEPNFEI